MKEDWVAGPISIANLENVGLYVAEGSPNKRNAEASLPTRGSGLEVHLACTLEQIVWCVGMAC